MLAGAGVIGYRRFIARIGGSIAMLAEFGSDLE